MWYVWYAWYVWLMIVSISIPPRSPRHPSSIQIVGDSDLDLAEPGDQKNGSYTLWSSGYVKIAIENGHRNSGITHWKWWFSIVMFIYQRVY